MNFEQALAAMREGKVVRSMDNMIKYRLTLHVFQWWDMERREWIVTHAFHDSDILAEDWEVVNENA